MSATHVWVSEYADELIATPRGRLPLTLAQDERGLVLIYREREILRCFLTPNGMVAGGFVAQALGLTVPPLGESRETGVSTGVLYRVLGVCQLDYEEEASYVVLERLLEEAEMQRGSSGGY